jgi:purine-binding chemotaxis protein CheW
MNLEEKNISTFKQQSNIFATFDIGGVEVAINVKSIQEVVNFPERIIPMPLAPQFLIGVFNLRGLIIPIVNLKSLLKFEDSSVSTNQKVAIVDHEGAKVGLLFDSTNEIIRVNDEMLSNFNYVEEKSHKVISGAIKLDSGNRIIQVLAPFELLLIENIPQILEQQSRKNVNNSSSIFHHEKRKKCISFSVGEMNLGFEITGIHEIIKVPSIQTSSVDNDICIGIVNLRGQTVPVIDLALLLKMDTNTEKRIEEKRIIILKVENELFGLLVDGVNSINTYMLDELMQIPLLSKSRSNMFLGCLSIENVGEIILLNYNEILSNSEILEITHGHSKIYSSNLEATTKQSKQMNRQAYISFKLDHLFGVSIKDIREIINLSDEIVSAPGMPSFVKGLLNLRGKLITIIDTRALYAMEIKNNFSASSKILIFDIADERFGLIVDSVESIVTVDEDKKMKVPSLMVKNVQEQFDKDIKEIITFKQNEDKEGILVILNMEPVTHRIKQSIAA